MKGEQKATKTFRPDPVFFVDRGFEADYDKGITEKGGGPVIMKSKSTMREVVNC